MNCPKCGHPVESHGKFTHKITWRVEGDSRLHSRVCDCKLTEAKALIAAQRHAAAELFKEIWMENKPPEVTAIRVSFVEKVLRKCGVLEENERYEMLLSLIMNKNPEGEQ